MTDAKPDLTTTAGRIADLRSRLEEATAPLGTSVIDHIHATGGMTSRERVYALLDEGTFVETDALVRHRVTELKMDRNRPATDGVITGYGQIHGRRMCVYAHDDTIFDGSLGEVGAEKILKIYELAAKTGVPLVSIHAADATRVIENVAGLAMATRLLNAATQASGLVPQISIISGTVTGVTSIIASMADVIIQTEGSSMHLAEANVVSEVTGAEATSEILGGAETHARTTGITHLVGLTDIDSIALARDVFSYLPANNHAEAPRTTGPVIGKMEDNIHNTDRALDSIIPDDDNHAHDITEIISNVVDEGAFLELQPQYADNIITALARIEGRSIGIVATQPTSLAGCINRMGAAKAARFIRFCDAFNIPIVEFVDSPGFLPGTEQEHAGTLRTAAQLASAYAAATVGKMTVITRKAIGPAFAVMGSKELGADFSYAWPTAQISVADAFTASKALNEQISEQTWRDEYLTPYKAAESGLVDAVIEPSRTRGMLIEGLRLLDRKVVTSRPKKHTNLPL